jgi:hypothetical protein
MGVERRIAVVLAGAVLGLAGCGGDQPARPAPPDLAGKPVPWRTDGLDRVQRTRAEAEEIAWRRAELAKLERSVTVGAALRRALLTEAIGRRAHDRYRAALDGAR